MSPLLGMSFDLGCKTNGLHDRLNKILTIHDQAQARRFILKKISQMVASIREMVYVNFQVLISFRDFPVNVSIIEDKEAGDYGPDTLLLS